MNEKSTKTKEINLTELLNFEYKPGEKQAIENMVKFRDDPNLYVFWRNVYNARKDPETAKAAKTAYFENLKTVNF